MSLHFYGWATPNSNRVSILLEELGLRYGVTGVDIRAGGQFSPEVLRLNPYGKIPILVQDSPPLVLFESGAILLHLAEVHGRFLPEAGAARAEVLVWLMVVLTSLGPFTGQAHHWTALAAERPGVARAHSVGLVRRVYGVLEGRLGEAAFLGGADYSIADIAAYPWVARHDWAELDLGDFPALARWAGVVGARPGVMRGMAVPEGARLG